MRSAIPCSRPSKSLAALRDLYKQAISTCTPAGRFVNDNIAIFTFVHCANSKAEAIEARACEAVLWYVNHVAAVFRVPRANVMGMIRGGLLPKDAKLTLGPEGEENKLDPDDPVPVIRLLNRQMLGIELDPEEVFDTLEPLDAVIIGDVDACTAKMQSFADIGVDRLLCFQQFGGLSNEDVTRSMRLVGKEIPPALKG